MDKAHEHKPYYNVFDRSNYCITCGKRLPKADFCGTCGSYLTEILLFTSKTKYCKVCEGGTAKPIVTVADDEWLAEIEKAIGDSKP